MAASLVLDRLTKSFGDFRAVRETSLEVEAGEFVTLLGPSGSGKTTILRMIAGFEAPTTGRILLAGRDISDLAPARRGIGVVFQQYALFPHMTVEENIRYPLRKHGWSHEAATRRVGEMLELVKLEAFGRRYPRELSGGQQQRVALARAIAFQPSLLLMDEPLGALDRALRLHMEEEIRRIHRETGATILYVTHDQEEALTLSDRILVMREGRILQAGRPVDLFERPTEPFVATFFGDCTLIPATVGEGGVVSTLDQSFSAPTDHRGPASVGVRPGRFRLPVARREGDVGLTGTVEEILYLGETTRLRLRHETVGEIVARVPDAGGIVIGQTLDLYFAPSEAAIIPSKAEDER